MLRCEWREIFKNTYFEEHLRTAASTLCEQAVKSNYVNQTDAFTYLSVAVPI